MTPWLYEDLGIGSHGNEVGFGDSCRDEEGSRIRGARKSRSVMLSYLESSRGESGGVTHAALGGGGSVRLPMRARVQDEGLASKPGWR